MLLVGMFDSPYVRRVAISMRTLQIPWQQQDAPAKVVVRFEHFTLEQPVSKRGE